MSASYTYLMAEATDDGGLPTATFAAGERLIRRPGHSAELSARGRVDRVALGGSLIYVGSREDVDFNLFPAERVELPGYATVDLATEVDVIQSHPGSPGLSAVLRAENLFDQAYDQVVGFAGRGRTVFGGAKFQF